jgi:hypothetical protein
MNQSSADAKNPPFVAPLPMLSHCESDRAENVVRVYVLFELLAQPDQKLSWKRECIIYTPHQPDSFTTVTP